MKSARRNPPATRSPLTPLAAAVSLALGGAPVWAADVPPMIVADATPDTLEPVVVTANRREQNALDVPYNISTVSGAALENANATSLVDIARLLPGVTIPDLGARANASNSLITIRGLNINDPVGSSYLPWGSVPTVSTYVDDVPQYVNLRLDDIQRVEVLRGPQGTLYGSGAVAGTVKIQHNAPDLSAFAGLVGTDVSQTDHAGNPSGALHFMLNTPVSDTFGLRFAGSTQYQAGFINATGATVFGPNTQPVLANPSSPATSGLVTQPVAHIDDAHGYNLRAAGLWKALPGWTANFTVQRQEDHSNGFSSETTGLAFQTAALVPQQPEHRIVDLDAVTLTGDLGFATVTSSTSYSVNRVDNTYDESQFVIAYDTGTPALYGNYPRITSLFFSGSRDTSFTQEFRLASKPAPGDPWDYTAGLFLQHQAQNLFQHETIPGFAAWSQLPGSAAAINAYTGGNYASFGNYLQSLGGTPPAAVSPTDTNFTYLRNSSFTDRALFGELTRHITDQWQVTGGARVFAQEFDQNLYSTIPYGGPAYSTLPYPANLSDSAGTTAVDRVQNYHNHTFKLNTGYVLSPELHTYATYSEGFRHGGINALPLGACVFCENPSIVPYKPDTVKNYEIGAKGETGHWLRYSAAVYLVNWNDIQIQTFGQAGDPAVVNGKTARSQGIELEANAKLGEGWTGNLGYGYTDSKLTQDFSVIDVVPQAFVPVVPLIIGHSGDRLPNVPRQTFTADVGYLRALDGEIVLDTHLSAAYRSDIVTEINNSVPGYTHLGGFTTFNGSVGASYGRNWHGKLYVNNITNVLGITSAGQLFRNFADPRYTVEYPSRPRTIGLAAEYSFD